MSSVKKNQNRFCQSQYTTITKGLTTKIKIIVMIKISKIIKQTKTKQNKQTKTNKNQQN